MVAVTINICWVGHWKFSGSGLKIVKPRRPARVKVSSFDSPDTPCPRKRPGKRLNGVKVGHDDSKQMVFCFSIFGDLSFECSFGPGVVRNHY